MFLEIDRDRAASVASSLLGAMPVQDISILDPPLEEILEAIYRKSARGE